MRFRNYEAVPVLEGPPGRYIQVEREYTMFDNPRVNRLDELTFKKVEKLHLRFAVMAQWTKRVGLRSAPGCEGIGGWVTNPNCEEKMVYSEAGTQRVPGFR
jgi:hypothetical protein